MYEVHAANAIYDGLHAATKEGMQRFNRQQYWGEQDQFLGLLPHPDYHPQYTQLQSTDSCSLLTSTQVSMRGRATVSPPFSSPTFYVLESVLALAA